MRSGHTWVKKDITRIVNRTARLLYRESSPTYTELSYLWGLSMGLLDDYQPFEVNDDQRAALNAIVTELERALAQLQS